MPFLEALIYGVRDILNSSNVAFTRKSRVKLGTGLSGTVDETNDCITLSANGGGGGALEVKEDGVSVVAAATALNFLGTKVTDSSPVANVQPAVVYTTTVANDNLTTSRANRLATDNTKTGVTNLGSDSSGVQTGATANYATVMGGDRNNVSGVYASVGGLSSAATGAYSWAYGNGADAASSNSFAFGAGAQTTFDNARAFGSGCLAWQIGATAMGNACLVRALGQNGVAMGGNAEVWDTHGVGIGFAPLVLGPYSTCFGAATESWGPATFSCNEDTQAFGLRSSAMNEFTQSKGLASASFNRCSAAVGDGSSSFGGQSIASRENQWALASGNFSNNGSGAAAANAQNSKLVLRGRTPGLAPNETGTLLYGSAGNQNLRFENNRCYAVDLTATITGYDTGTLSAVGCTIKENHIILVRGGTATIVASTIGTALGSAACAAWTLDVASPVINGSFTYTVTGSTARTMAEVTVDLHEVTYPIDTPLDVDDCTLWLDASALPAGALASWTDGSGAGVDFAQASAGSRPTVVAAALNGLNGVQFDGVNDFMTTTASGKTLADIIQAGAYTLFIIGQFDTNAVAGAAFPTLPALFSESVGVIGVSANSSGSVYGWQAGAPATYAFVSGSWAIGQAFSYVPWEQVHGVTARGTTTIIRMEEGQGENRPATTDPIYDLTGTLQIGESSDGTGFLDGFVYEVLAYNRTLTEGEREQVYQYLKDKWAF